MCDISTAFVPPRPPRSVSAVSITSEGVSIQWRLEEDIVPTHPETYTVRYGTSSDNIINVAQEITVQDNTKNLSIPIDSLQPGTRYYYRIDTENMFDSLSTDVMSFITDDISEKLMYYLLMPS